VNVGFLFPSPRFGHGVVVVPPVYFGGAVGDAVTFDDGVGGSDAASAVGTHRPRRSSGLLPAIRSSGPSVMLLFGGMHSMYCANELWQLRVRRRRARVFRDGGDAATLDADSGSDGEDWIVQPSPDEANGEADGKVADDDEYDSGPVGLVEWAGVPFHERRGQIPRVTLSEKHDRATCSAVLHSMQEQLIALRMQASQADTRHATLLVRKEAADAALADAVAAAAHADASARAREAALHATIAAMETQVCVCVSVCE
jgi:hypothetical protein